MNIQSARELRDAIQHKYSASNARVELYVIEHYHDYKMVGNCFIVKQSNEIELIVSELQ